jgi:hypothetical protein
MKAVRVEHESRGEFCRFAVEHGAKVGAIDIRTGQIRATYLDGPTHIVRTKYGLSQVRLAKIDVYVAPTQELGPLQIRAPERGSEGENQIEDAAGQIGTREIRAAHQHARKRCVLQHRTLQFTVSETITLDLRAHTFSIGEKKLRY